MTHWLIFNPINVSLDIITDVFGKKCHGMLAHVQFEIEQHIGYI